MRKLQRVLCRVGHVPPVERIAISRIQSCILERFGVAFGALAILHASTLWVCGAAWAVHHAPGDGGIKQRVLGSIRDFCRNHLVVVGGVVGFGGRVKNDEEVCMREAALLKFNNMDVRHHPAQNAVLEKELQQGLQFQAEDTAHQIRAVLGALPWQQSCHNLRPVGVAGDGQESIWFPKGADNRHRILQM